MPHFARGAIAFASTVLAFVLCFQTTARAETIQIAAVGDSNIAGRGVAESDAYPAKLERALHAKGFDVRVLNNGLNGDTTAGLLGRIDQAAPPGTQIAIVWIGVNDRRAGVPLATIQASRQAIVNHLRGRGIEVLSFNGDPGADLRNHPELTTGDQQGHFNAAGYDRIVARTLPQVITLVQRVQQKGH
jgi:acyl-CoA thioesterase-1